MLSENQQNQQRALAQTQANLANQQNNNNKDNNYNGNGNGNNNGIAIVNQQGPTSIGFGNYNPQLLFKCRGTFVGHKAAVWALIVHGDKLYSGSGDASIKVWDCMVTFKNLETLQGHSGQVLCLAASGNFLFSGSHDKTIRHSVRKCLMNRSFSSFNQFLAYRAIQNCTIDIIRQLLE